MANVPLDLKDEIAMRRFLSSLEGGNFIISGSTYINTSGWVTDLPVLSLPVLSDYVKGRVATFNELMQFTIDEINYNIGILGDAVNTRIDTVSSETGANTASISTLDQTYATDLVVGAIHSLTVTANGHVSGYTSIATGTNSVFKIYAEQFAVSSSATQEGYSPFQIDTVGHKINMTSNVAIDGALVVAGTITANQIAASTITADKISSYNLTSTNATIGNAIIGNASIQDLTIAGAKMANGAMGGIGYSAFSGSMSSAVTTYGDGLTSANTVVVGSFYFYNSSNKSINISVTVAGRSGYVAGYTGYYAWGIFNGTTLLYDYGWAPWDSVAIAGSAKYSLAANSGSTIYVRACVSTAGTTASLAGSIAITGIIV